MKQGKNFVNKNKLGVRKNFVSKEFRNLNVANKSSEETPLVLVENKDTSEDIVLRVNKEQMYNHSIPDLVRVLTSIFTPLFLFKKHQVGRSINSNKLGGFIKGSNKTDVNLIGKKNEIHEINQAFPHIAFFVDNKSHYTGGRYSIFHQAVILSNYTKVTFITDENPKFLENGDFDNYMTENFKVLLDPTYLSDDDNNSNNFDIVFGVPMQSGIMATNYAERNNLPLYLMIFESPNWVSKYKDSPDATEEYWKSYKKCLMKADKIITPSFESKVHVAEWLGEGNPQIDVIYPCINTVLADKAKKLKSDKIGVCISTRMVDFKSPLGVIKKWGDGYEDIEFHLIGKIPKLLRDEINKLIEKGYNIKSHGVITDELKFDIIKSCELLIHPSLFEGFGMPPMEALYYNKRVVAYDLPVLREVYGDLIKYAEFNNIKGFIKLAKETLAETMLEAEKGLKLDIRKKVYYNSSIKRCADDLIKVFNVKKVTAGTIVYNGEDYIRYSIRSLIDNLYKVIIVDGSVKKYSNKGASTDDTLKIIKEMKENDIFGKIELVETKVPFENKIQKQNMIVSNIPDDTDYYLKLDHDEIWNKEDFIKCIDYMIKKETDVLKVPFLHFWLNFKTIARDNGGKWGTKHPRIWKWRKTFIHKKSFNYFNDTDNSGTKVSAPQYKEDTINDGVNIFHFGYVRKIKLLKEKLKYYKTRGIEKFVTDTVTKWKDLKSPTQPTQKVDSWAEEFEGELPSIMKNHPYSKVEDIREV